MNPRTRTLKQLQAAKEAADYAKTKGLVMALSQQDREGTEFLYILCRESDEFVVWAGEKAPTTEDIDSALKA